MAWLIGIVLSVPSAAQRVPLQTIEGMELLTRQLQCENQANDIGLSPETDEYKNSVKECHDKFKKVEKISGVKSNDKPRSEPWSSEQLLIIFGLGGSLIVYLNVCHFLIRRMSEKGLVSVGYTWIDWIPIIQLFPLFRFAKKLGDTDPLEGRNPIDATIGRELDVGGMHNSIVDN